MKKPFLIYPRPKYTLQFLYQMQLVNQAKGIKYESESTKLFFISFIFTNCHEI